MSISWNAYDDTELAALRAEAGMWQSGGSLTAFAILVSATGVLLAAMHGTFHYEGTVLCAAAIYAFVQLRQLRDDIRSVIAAHTYAMRERDEDLLCEVLGCSREHASAMTQGEMAAIARDILWSYESKCSALSGFTADQIDRISAKCSRELSVLVRAKLLNAEEYGRMMGLLGALKKACA